MTANDVERREVAEQLTAVGCGTVDLADIGPWISATFGRVAAVIGAQGAGPVGPPFARYFPAGTERFRVEAGFPTSRRIDPTDDVEPSTLPAGPVAATTHIGSYDGVGEAYVRISAWAEEHGATTGTGPWEVYLTDPTSQPDPTTWRTDVFVPIEGVAARSTA